MSPMFKQKVGMTKIYAKGIAELFLIRCNPYHWDGSGEVPDNISFDVYKRKIDETYDGCTLEIQLCKPDGCYLARFLRSYNSQFCKQRADSPSRWACLFICSTTKNGV